MYEPLTIIGVKTDQVGRPTNDGTPGGGPYSVPIQLSRNVTAREAQLLRHHWDHPPQYTNMHRPGTASVGADVITLTQTTIDEVSRYHAATLRLVVDAANQDEAALRLEDERAAASEAQAEVDHRNHVETVAAEIKF